VSSIARLASLALLAVLALTLAARAHATRADATLNAKVGPSFTIALTDSTGATVTHLDPGTYTINVDDEATIHNFHLAGPGVDETTSIDGTGKTTWTVTFSDGTYTFLCDAHPTTLKGTFTVGSGSPPVTTTSSPPAPPALPRLVATVGPGTTISLRRPSGVLVHTLHHGRYRITVRDRSAAHDFHLIGPGLSKKTTVGFVGTTTWTLTLKVGAYAYRCDPHKAFMHGSFRVT
jgi:plastocyanin